MNNKYEMHKALANNHRQFIPKDYWSARTHFWGIIGSVLLTPVLLIRASSCSFVQKVGFAVYMLSLFTLYAASTCYHAFDIGTPGNMRLKKLDHVSIFILIAGTYTPVCLTILNGIKGYILLGVVWSIALCGIVFKLCWVTCPKWISSVLYTAMGWTCLSVLPDLIRIPLPAFLLLLGGGLMYTVGAVIYATKKTLIDIPGFGNHELFHVFVLAGSLLHYLMICLFLC